MSLFGARVLVVEDEPLLRLGLEDMVSELGGVLAGSEGALPQALRLAQSEQFDIAVLDVNLGGKRVDPICDVLAHRGIPFIFTTGYDSDSVPKPGLATAILQKPYTIEEFRAAVEAALASRSTR